MPVDEDEKPTTPTKKLSFLVTCCNCGTQVELKSGFGDETLPIDVCVSVDYHERRENQVNIECRCGNDIYQN